MIILFCCHEDVFLLHHHPTGFYPQITEVPPKARHPQQKKTLLNSMHVRLMSLKSADIYHLSTYPEFVNLSSGFCTIDFWKCS
jgi:hypothetical protein